LVVLVDRVVAANLCVLRIAVLVAYVIIAPPPTAHLEAIWQQLYAAVGLELL
jgi:hypothetical protein